MTVPRFQQKHSGLIYTFCKWIYVIISVGYWFAVPIIGYVFYRIDEPNRGTGFVSLDWGIDGMILILFFITIPLYLYFLFGGQLIRTLILRCTNSISNESTVVRAVIWSLFFMASIVLHVRYL